LHSYQKLIVDQTLTELTYYNGLELEERIDGVVKTLEERLKELEEKQNALSMQCNNPECGKSLQTLNFMHPLDCDDAHLKQEDGAYLYNLAYLYIFLYHKSFPPFDGKAARDRALSPCIQLSTLAGTMEACEKG
jgi:hypothetical protein